MRVGVQIDYLSYLFAVSIDILLVNLGGDPTPRTTSTLLGKALTENLFSEKELELGLFPGSLF